MASLDWQYMSKLAGTQANLGSAADTAKQECGCSNLLHSRRPITNGVRGAERSSRPSTGCGGGISMSSPSPAPVSSPRQFQSPPTTPRAKPTVRSYTPPSPPRPKPPSDMMKALAMNSLEGVRACLREDPRAAQLPFFDHNVEPPLCFAVRHHCSFDIIETLLEHGGDVNGCDLSGKKPIDILMETEKLASDLAWSFPPWMDMTGMSPMLPWQVPNAFATNAAEHSHLEALLQVHMRVENEVN
eukprot:CAMPEP_0178397952 /NCGR_PEP_ID=MMETSP0689_2-20121128/14523_1 /TAXON_ID=160604 /ORGANISM="Amphidinium massartii, Strain CS-259" /LENGTH=242 /DNA_ID=CAMNT_0020018701 /DNA_START=65 /DNA_END=794 /DNA_ORIENTATION=+